MVRKIESHIPMDILEQDLEAYRCTAIEAGASDARIITSDQILIDERVRAKCLIPACSSLGKNAHCPPHAPDLDFMRKVVEKYQYAVFYMLKVPSTLSAGPEFKARKLGMKPAMQNWKICSTVESRAFYDGYYLAMGLAGGPCGPYLCGGQECRLLAGGGCRNPGKSRPAMEAVGMDVFSMAAGQGWEVYPIGASISAAEVPHGSRFGLVLIH